MAEATKPTAELSGAPATGQRFRRRPFLDLAPRGIGWRLLLSILLFSAFITLILTAFELYLDYRRGVGALEARLDQISGSYTDSLAEGLWTLDQEQLRLQLMGILRLPDVLAVEVREADVAGPLVVKVGVRSAQTSAISRQYPLRYRRQGQDSAIGALYIQATLTPIYNALYDQALTILFTQAVKTFLTSLFIIYIVHLLVTRHLFAIARYVGDYRIADPPQRLRLARRPPRHEDELDRMVAAFNGLSEHLQLAYRDVSNANSKLAHDATLIAEREARIRRLVDSNIIGIYIWRLDGQIVEANDAFLGALGYNRDDLAAGRVNRADLTPPDRRDRTAREQVELTATGTVQPYETEFVRKDGGRVPVLLGSASFDASSSQGVTFVLDLTVRRRMEAQARDSERRYREVQAQLSHANRIATMGLLTASIAHEVNQPIAATVTNASAGLRWLGAKPPNLDEVRQALERIVRDGGRAGAVISRVRAHIKRAPHSDEQVDINAAVLEVIELTRSEAVKSGVTVHSQLDDGLPAVRGDRVELQQVILNLILNAHEAMSEIDGGSREMLVATGATESGDALVTVRDSGPGLAAGVAERLFEAFFTTKSSGLGVGLPICRAIIEAHGGRLWASANAPRGAVFQFTLPSVERKAADDAPLNP